MADELPEFETEDQRGQSRQFAGSVNTTPIQVPATPGEKMEVAIIRCPTQTPNTAYLEWSIDGVIYHKLGNGEFVGWEFRKDSGGADIEQLYVKGSIAGGVDYEILANFKDA